MARRFDATKFNREMRAAQRKAEAEWKRQVDRVNRENQRSVDAYNREIDRVNRENERRVDAHNRKVDQHNKKVVTDYNSDVDRVNARNRAVVADLNRQLRAASSGPRYTAGEQALAESGPACRRAT